MTGAGWSAWARAALRRGDDCPDAEALRTWRERPASPAVEAVAEHVARCARCRFEAAEMSAFLSESGEPDDAARELESALRAVLASGGAGAVRRRRPFRLLPLAAVLVLAASALALLLRDRAPVIPDAPVRPGVARGVPAPRPIEPVGHIATTPDHLAWAAAPGDEGPWQVRLETVDGQLLWSASTAESWLALPAAVAVRLEQGSRYIWRVGTTGQEGLARAQAFWIEPEPAK